MQYTNQKHHEYKQGRSSNFGKGGVGDDGGGGTAQKRLSKERIITQNELI